MMAKVSMVGMGSGRCLWASRFGEWPGPAGCAYLGQHEQLTAQTYVMPSQAGKFGEFNDIGPPLTS